MPTQKTHNRGSHQTALSKSLAVLREGGMNIRQASCRGSTRAGVGQAGSSPRRSHSVPEFGLLPLGKISWFDNAGDAGETLSRDGLKDTTV